MANNPNDEFPDNTNAPSTAYPYGSARNVTEPGDNTGTPWEEQFINDVFGFQQALLAAANLTPSGVPDQVGASQYLEALQELFSKTYVFDNLNALQAEDLPVGVVASTRGRNSAGDGQAGDYLIQAAQTIDGVLDVDLLNGNVAIQQAKTFPGLRLHSNAGQAGLSFNNLAASGVQGEIRMNFATGEMRFYIEGAEILALTETSFFPNTTDAVDLGSLTNLFSEVYSDRMRIVDRLTFGGVTDPFNAIVSNSNGYEVYADGSIMARLRSNGWSVTTANAVFGLTGSFIVNGSSNPAYLLVSDSNTGTGSYEFKRPESGNVYGGMRYDHDDDVMWWLTNDSERMALNASGQLMVSDLANTRTPLGRAHISTGFTGATALDVSTSADELVLESAGNTGLTIMSNNAGSSLGSVHFNNSSGVQGIIQYSTGEKLEMGVDANIQVALSGVRFAPVALQDDSLDLGGSGRRWSDIYATNATIQTSDANQKQQRGGLSAAELAAWERVQPVVFQWLSAIEEKGEEGARLHNGWIAQEVEAAFEAEGLDAGRYGVLIKNEIMEDVTETVEVTVEETEEVTYTESSVEVIDGVATRVTRERTATSPVYDVLPIFDENGDPVMETVPVYAANGDPVMETVPVLDEQGLPVFSLEVVTDEDGAPVLDENGDPTTQPSDVPLTESVAVTETRQQEFKTPRLVTVTEEVVTGQVGTGVYEYGLRYNECMMFEIAHLRAKLAELTE